METAPPVSFPLEGITLPGPAVTAECIISLSKSSAEVKVVLQPEELPKPSNGASHSILIPSRQDSERTPGTSRGIIQVQSTNQLDPPCITESHMFAGLEPTNHQDVHVCEVSVQSEYCKDLKEHSLLSIQRSHSDSYQDCKEVTGSHLCETGVLNRHLKVQDVPSFPSLVCKQAMPLQQSNTVTTSTRAGSTSPGSPTQLAKHAHVQICQCGQAGCRIAESERPIVEEVVCGNSHILYGSVEDTCAAYCHPQPIPAPAQLLPQSCWTQASPRHMLALPRLISSVSETGLDGQRLFRCCNQDCSWPGPLRSSGQWVGGKSTKEAGTMTLQIKMRDKAIQVEEEPEERPKHVFPEVCLMEANTRPKSPIREVKWDAEGMTWDVYGASVDPEELGFAIQKHLEIQIKETKGIASKLSRQNTATSQQSGSSWRRKKSLFGSLRHPGCCSRSTTAVD